MQSDEAVVVCISPVIIYVHSHHAVIDVECQFGVYDEISYYFKVLYIKFLLR